MAGGSGDERGSPLPDARRAHAAQRRDHRAQRAIHEPYERPGTETAGGTPSADAPVHVSAAADAVAQLRRAMRVPAPLRARAFRRFWAATTLSLFGARRPVNAGTSVALPDHYASA